MGDLNHDGKISGGRARPGELARNGRTSLHRDLIVPVSRWRESSDTLYPGIPRHELPCDRLVGPCGEGRDQEDGSSPEHIEKASKTARS